MKAAHRRETWRRVGQSVRKIRQDAKHWKPKHRRFGSLAVRKLCQARVEEVAHAAEEPTRRTILNPNTRREAWRLSEVEAHMDDREKPLALCSNVSANDV